MRFKILVTRSSRRFAHSVFLVAIVPALFLLRIGIRGNALQKECPTFAGGHLAAEQFFEPLEDFLMRHHFLPGERFRQFIHNGKNGIPTNESWRYASARPISLAGCMVNKRRMRFSGYG